MLMVQAMTFSTQLILKALDDLGAPETPLTYDDIAARVGCSHQTIRRAIKKLREENAITRTGGPRGGYNYIVRSGAE